MTRKQIVCILAVLCLHFERAWPQALTGKVLRVQPTALPSLCNTGDMRNDQADSNKVKLCRANVWTTLLTSDGGSVDPTTTLGDMSYNNGSGAGVLARLPVGGLNQVLRVTPGGTPGWTSVITASFVGALTGTASQAGTASFSTTASFSGTASTAGTASFAAVSGTASAATAFTSTPTACAAGVWANAIGPNGNLTCAVVSTASTSGTAFFSATSGTASAATAFTAVPTACGAGVYASSIAANGNLTCTIVSTASQAGTAAFASAFNGTMSIAQGGTNNGTLAVTNGGVLWTDGSKIMNTGVGTAAQVLQSNGAAAPTWVSYSAPTVQSITATGVFTYTPPGTVGYLEVEIVGGGAGGSGCGGTTASVAGGNGGLTNFGTAAFAGGGNGGGTNGNVGANATLSFTTAATILAQILGKSGQGGSSGVQLMGGMGAGSPFAGTGNGGSSQVQGSPNGGVGSIYSGSGGGGGGSGQTVGSVSGAGGGAGSYLHFYITSIAASYTGSVGTFGTGSATGCNNASGGNGGNGGSGVVVVRYRSGF